MKRILRIALTLGEPAGIGPDIAVQLAQTVLPAEIVVIADQGLLAARAKQLHLPLHLSPVDLAQAPEIQPKGHLRILHVPLRKSCQAGQLNPENAEYVLETLKLAGLACMNGEFAAVVTGPVHKAVMRQAGFDFPGHTEYFAQLTHAPQAVMLLVTEGLRVALATTHIPLREVPAAIKAEDLTQTLRILCHDLHARFAIKAPKIWVCGLNPHAGEGGYLGEEEIKVITPVITRLQEEGLLIYGPVSADSIFTPHYLKQADAILAMYHDQGLPVLKFKGFHHGVNVTLGLPIIRTSVDHGTALHLAGTGRSDFCSLQQAVLCAVNLANNSG